MKKKLTYLFLIGFLSTLFVMKAQDIVESQSQFSRPRGLAIIEEEDAAPSTRPRVLKVTNGTLTDNGDGSVSITTGGGIATDHTLDRAYDGGDTIIADAGAVTINASGGDYALHTTQTGDESTIRVESGLLDALPQRGAIYVTSSVAGNGIFGESSTDGTGNILYLHGGALSTGRALYVYSDDADTDAHSLVEIHNDNPTANQTETLRIINDGIGDVDAVNIAVVDSTDLGTGLLIQSNAKTTGNAVRLFDENASASMTTGSFLEIDATSPSLTTSDIVDIEMIDNSTGNTWTGSLIHARADNSDSSTRNMVEFIQDHASATGTTALYVQNDSTGNAITTVGDVDITGKLTVSGLIDPTGIQITEQAADPASTPAGFGTYWVRNDSPSVPVFTDDTGADFVLNTAASGNTLDQAYDQGGAGAGRTITADSGSVTINGSNNTSLTVSQTDVQTGIFIDQDGNDFALEIDTEATSSSGIKFTNLAQFDTGIGLDMRGFDALTNGNIAHFESDSTSGSTRSLVYVDNNNTLAAGTTVLELKQDADHRTLFVDHNNAGGNAIYVDGEQTTDTGVHFEFDALTSGKGVSITSDSASGSSHKLLHINNNTGTGGVPAEFIQNAVGSTRVLDILHKGTTSDGTGVNVNYDPPAGRAILITLDNSATSAHGIQISHDATTGDAINITKTNNSNAIDITTSANGALVGGIDITPSGTGPGLYIDSGSTYTGNQIYLHGGNLSTGRSLYLYNDNATTDSRNLAEIHNDNTASTGTTLLRLTQDSTGNAVVVADNASTGSGIAIQSNSKTTGNGIIVWNDGGGSGLSTGKLLHVHSNDTNATSGPLVFFDNRAASGGKQVLELENDAATTALLVDQNGNGRGILVQSDGTTESAVQVNGDSITTVPALLVTANGLTTGEIAVFSSTSASGSSRNVVEITNSSASADAAVALRITQAGGSQALILNGQASAGTSLVEILNITSSDDAPHIHFSGDPINTVPEDGDLWWNGTQLYFKDATDTHDLLATGPTALNAAYDSGWLTSNDNTNYTRAHGISGLSIPGDGLMIKVLWRSGSGDTEVTPVEFSTIIASEADRRIAYNGTNILIDNNGNWGRTHDSAFSNVTMNNGELRIFAWTLD